MDAGGRTVSKDRLIDACWPRAEVSDQSLARAIADLRKLFRRHGDDPVKTIYGVGYRLEAADPVLPNKGQSDRKAQSQKAALLYEEARHRIHVRRSGSLDVAERLLRDAEVMHDSPDNWLAIAETHIHRMQLGYATVPTSWPQARIALEQALKKAPADALALMALGFCWAEWDFTTAGKMLERARRIDPTSYTVNQCTAYRERMVGNYDLAVHYFRRAIEANPIALPPHAGIAMVLATMGQASEALAEAQEMTHLDGESPISLGFRALVGTRLGNPEPYLLMAKQCFSLLPESPVAAAILACTLAASGQAAEARSLLESPSISEEPFGNVSSYACWAWLRLEEPHRALRTLHHCSELHCPQLPIVLRDPALRPIANDQTFRDTFSAVFGEETVGTPSKDMAPPAGLEPATR
jgi:tetratricopeptide (TPR) repeat protein